MCLEMYRFTPLPCTHWPCTHSPCSHWLCTHNPHNMTHRPPPPTASHNQCGISINGRQNFRDEHPPSTTKPNTARLLSALDPGSSGPIYRRTNIFYLPQLNEPLQFRVENTVNTDRIIFTKCPPSKAQRMHMWEPIILMGLPIWWTSTCNFHMDFL